MFVYDLIKDMQSRTQNRGIQKIDPDQRKVLFTDREAKVVESAEKHRCLVGELERVSRHDMAD